MYSQAIKLQLYRKRLNSNTLVVKIQILKVYTLKIIALQRGKGRRRKVDNDC